MTNAIETDGLTRHFGRTRAVDRLTLQIPAGRTGPVPVDESEHAESSVQVPSAG